MEYYNPYTGVDFFGFFIQAAARFWQFISGRLGIESLVSDEIQIIVLCAVAASTSLLGCFLVLRKMTMLANALSHTILIGIVAAYYFSLEGVGEGQGHHHTLNISAMLVASIAVGFATTYLTEFLTKTIQLQEDASIGIVFTSLFALGIIMVTLLTRSAHIGTEVVMGNVDALQPEDISLVSIILLVNLAMVFLFYKEYNITTFDAGLSLSLGISPLIFNYLLMTQVSATAIGAFRAVGVLMVLAFITGPALSARLLTHNLKWMLAISIVLGCTASMLGVAFSRHLLTLYGAALSTGGLVVCFIAVLFAASFGYYLYANRPRLVRDKDQLSDGGSRF